MIKSVLPTDSEFDVIGSSDCFSRSSAGENVSRQLVEFKDQSSLSRPWTNVILSEHFRQDRDCPEEN